MSVQIPFATIFKVHGDAVVEDIFFTGILQQCRVNESAPQWLVDIRQQSKNWLSRLSVPTRKDEDWRFIDLSSLTAGKFVTPSQDTAIANREFLPETDNRLVFVNGIYSSQLSNTSQLPEGLYLGSLHDLPAKYDAAKYFAQQPGTDAFTALNTAGGDDIAVIWVQKNVVVDTPIQLVFIADGEKETSFAQPRTLVVAETGSSISLIEEYAGAGEYFTNAGNRSFCARQCQGKPYSPPARV